MDEKRRFRYRLKDFDLARAESKRDYNRLLFSPVAEVYARITQLLSFGRDRAWKRALVAALPQMDTPTILDLACGPGDLAYLLATRYPAAEVVGVDLSAAMLRKAEANRSRVPAEVARRISFEEGDMTQLLYSDDRFDLVSGGYALRNSPDLERTIDEIGRILKPGGYAAFLEFSRSDRPLRSRLQTGLLSFWGRFWGRVFHGNPEVYGYIAESLKRFPDQAAFRELVESRGFTVLRYAPRMLGMLRLILLRQN